MTWGPRLCRALNSVLARTLLVGVIAPVVVGCSTVVPPKALIQDVPFVSWHEAARLQYGEATDPSDTAAKAMVKIYWHLDWNKAGYSDRDAFFQIRADMEDWDIFETRTHGSLDDIKRWVARGVPLIVASALTAIADARGPEVRSAQRGTPGVLGTMEPLAPGGKAGDTRRTATRVVIGYDDGRQVIVLHDPSFGPASEVSYADFDVMWTARRRWYLNAHPPFYADIVAKRPPGAPYPSRSADQQAASAYIRGYALVSVRRVAEAEGEFTSGLAIPGISLGYRHLFLFELSKLYHARRDISKAIAAAQDASHLLPEHHRPWLFLAQLYREVRPDNWHDMAADAEKQAARACADPRAVVAVTRAIAHDFDVYGCEPLKLLRSNE